VQDNESLSIKGVLRGLHLQRPPHAQGKLVRVVSGAVFDVAVDLRKSSPHYGKWCSAFLSAADKNQLFIPAGFAHGFAVLENQTVFSYKCTGYYNKESEACIAWDDPDLGVDWPLEQPIISAKDKLQAEAFATFESPF
jgi:dTDP-4-dehydrorhamnose 3,5-epimerase